MTNTPPQIDQKKNPFQNIMSHPAPLIGGIFVLLLVVFALYITLIGAAGTTSLR